MKKLNLFFAFVALIATSSVYSQKLVSSKSHLKFFSTTPAEDIEANNYTSVSTIDKETGVVVFSVPMQGFEFEKSLMQKHFNSAKFLDTKTFPKAKLKGKITNLDEIDFTSDGSYDANFEGELTIKGVSKPTSEKGTIVVTGNKVEIQSKFDLTLADYGVTFIKGKPSSNIAKSVEITVKAEY